MTIANTRAIVKLEYITFIQGKLLVEKIITSQNKNYFTLYFENARPLLKTGAMQLGWGFLISSKAQVTLNITSLLLGGGLKAIPQLFKGVIWRKAFYSGLTGAAMRAFNRIKEDLQSDQVISPSKLLIEMDPIKNWYQSLEPLQYIFEYFLSHSDFIDQNTASELTDTISQSLLDHPVMTPCGHTFSFAQISKWQIEHFTCPNCREEIGQSTLSFNWPISLKLIKFVHYVIHTVQQSSYPLPQHLLTEEVKYHMLHLNQSTQKIMESIEKVAQAHFKQMKARNDINNEDYDQLMRAVHDWKVCF